MSTKECVTTVACRSSIATSLESTTSRDRARPGAAMRPSRGELARLSSCVRGYHQTTAVGFGMLMTRQVLGYSNSDFDKAHFVDQCSCVGMIESLPIHGTGRSSSCCSTRAFRSMCRSSLFLRIVTEAVAVGWPVLAILSTAQVPMTARARTENSSKNDIARPRLRFRRTKSLSLSTPPTVESGSPLNNIPESPSKPPVVTDDGFHAVFGFLGIPMVIAFIFSAAAMFYVAYVQVHPNFTANYLMNTENLDHGEFWLLKETPPALVVIGTTALTVFGFSYIALVAFMLCFRQRALPHSHPSGQKRKAAVRPRSQSSRFVIQPLRLFSTKHASNAGRNIHQGSQNDQKQPNRAVTAPPVSRLPTVLLEFTSIQGAYHCYYNAFFDLPKLMFQTASLITYLDKGFPLPPIYFYAALLLINWLISFYRFQRHAMDSKLVVTRLFYLFDLFFAVFAPMVVLAYAYYQFKMDRDEFALRESALSPGSYDRIARLFADPVQVDVFRDGFANMQLTKISYLIAKLCLNTLVLYKWNHIIVYLIQQQHLEAKQRQIGLKQPRASQIRLHGPQRKRHRFAGTVLFFSGIAFVVSYTVISITSSQRNCAPFQQCRVMSFEWLLSANDTACPCIVYIDRELMPTTFDQWMNPIDVTHELAEVARPGRLETVQIINRAVPTLPSELENCRSLQELILIYTKTQELPSWVKSFTHMHHLHVESNFQHYPLHTLPLDLFSEMKQLRFMRFGGPAALQEFPSLQGLRQLTTFVLSLPHSLTALPAFDGLERLATLFVADATHVPRLPSLQPLKNLKSFSLLRRNAVCCNGFVTGRCDITDFQCKPRMDEPVVKCVSERIDPQDLQLINSVNHFLCSVNLTSDVSDSEPTFESTDTLCGGVKYRQCTYNGHTGICYNGRMQVLHCDIFGEYEKLRRLEIARGIGPPCDPMVEKWLGCK